MIHRILIFDRKFNCRLDRRYPLNFNEENKNIPNSKVLLPVPSVKITDSASTGDVGVKHDEIGTDFNVNYNGSEEINKIWNVLNIKKTQFYDETLLAVSQSNSSGSLVSALDHLELDERSSSSSKEKESSPVEHSQQLILGLTYSLKNMLLKLAPIPSSSSFSNNNANASSSNTNANTTATEGYSFSYKTSKYRLFYFESFTGWRFIIISDNFTTSNTINNPVYGAITPETTLKVFYASIFIDFLVKYPLGTIYTTEKSTQKHRVSVENDFLHRKGFLGKLDEFIQICERIF